MARGSPSYGSGPGAVFRNEDLVPAWAMMLHNVAEQRKLAEPEVLKESLHAAELTASKEEQVMDGARQL